MSTPLKIQRMTGLDQSAMSMLRAFCNSWHNAAKLIHHTIGFTEKPDKMRDPLTHALQSYMQARSQGATDIERLSLVISDIFTAAHSLTPDITPDLYAQWCQEMKIPQDAYLKEIQRVRCD